MEKRSRLGRGLSSLLNSGGNDSVAAETASDSEIKLQTVPPLTTPEMFHVELSKIQCNPNQPRKQFDEATLATLAASIAAAGIIQPIVVRQVEDHYEVIAGERRFRAAQIAGLVTIPVIVRKVDAIEQSQLALIENIHREDLNPIDRAMAYRDMAKQSNLTHADIAARLGEERSGIANYIRLLDLPEASRALVRQGSLSVGHAKLLCGLDNPNEIDRLAQLVIAQQLSVRALEKLIKEGPPAAQTLTAKPASPHIADLERQLSRDLQMRTEVKQARKGGKGRLVIHYASLDQFDELLNRLGIKIDE
jgi:ParB family transcriptional regulator, chromosome partitioning protein